MLEDAAGAAPTPLAQFYARNPHIKLKEAPEHEYPRVLPVMRSNFKRK